MLCGIATAHKKTSPKQSMRSVARGHHIHAPGTSVWIIYWDATRVYGCSKICHRRCPITMPSRNGNSGCFIDSR